ncbi:2308_t:CDS:2, partial [Cetraspora pellucida]
RKCEKARKTNLLMQESEQPIVAVDIEADDVQGEENVTSIPQVEDNIIEINVEPLSATTISESEHELLRKFRNKMSKL